MNSKMSSHIQCFINKTYSIKHSRNWWLRLQKVSKSIKRSRPILKVHQSPKKLLSNNQSPITLSQWLNSPQTFHLPQPNPNKDLNLLSNSNSNRLCHHDYSLRNKKKSERNFFYLLNCSAKRKMMKERDRLREKSRCRRSVKLKRAACRSKTRKI